MYGNSDSRYFQLYVNGTASSSDKRIWSKFSEIPTTDGKRGPQSFTFTESDLTKIGDNYYLVLTDNTTEMKVATFTVTLTTGSYAVGGGEQGGGVLPTGLEDVMLDMNAPMYDVLGRKVGADYRGVVIQNGKAFLK